MYHIVHKNTAHAQDINVCLICCCLLVVRTDVSVLLNGCRFKNLDSNFEKRYLESVCIVTGGGCWVCLGTGERGQSSAGLRC